VLQKTMMLLTLFCIPLMTLFFFAEKFFNMLNQDPTVSHLAGHYCRFNMLAIWPGLNFQALLIFLQCQGIVLLDLYVNIFVNIVNAALSYFLIIYWGWGIDGVVAADIFNAWLFFFSLLFLIWWNGIHKETIPPPSCEIFKSWGNIFAIAVPGALMVCTETWLFEILQFTAGTYGSLPQAIYGLSFQVIMLPLIFASGFVIAVSTRVSNSLGAGDAKSARNSIVTAFVFVMFIMFTYSIVLIICDRQIGRIFTDDTHVVLGLSRVIPIIIIILNASAIQQVIAGALHGAGKQLEGSLANVIGYDIVALPLALVFAKYWKGGKDAAMSIWWGVFVGVVSVMIAMIIIFGTTDWNKEVEKAKKRIEDLESANEALMPKRDEAIPASDDPDRVSGDSGTATPNPSTFV